MKALIFAALLCGASTVFGEDVLSIKDVETMPQLVKAVEPTVSGDAVGETGMVKVEFVISTAGTATDCKISNSTNPKLNDAAIAAVSKWVFKPAQKQGAPVAVRTIVPVRFK